MKSVRKNQLRKRHTLEVKSSGFENDTQNICTKKAIRSTLFYLQALIPFILSNIFGIIHVAFETNIFVGCCRLPQPSEPEQFDSKAVVRGAGL